MRTRIETQLATAPQADDQASAELMDHHRHHHHGGLTQFIAMSLDTLGADDTKRPQIEKIQNDLRACMAPAGNIERKLHLALANGIAAGKIDKTKVDATIAQLDSATLPVYACGVGALNQLHGILSSTERWELVEKVQAHWDVWRQVNQEGEAGGQSSRVWLAKFSKELGLTPEQVDQIAAGLHRALAARSGKLDRRTVDANVQSFAAAFVDDSFDAKSITANATNRLVSEGAKRMSIFYETVTPLLTPEQRGTLAEHLREHADHYPVISAR